MLHWYVLHRYVLRRYLLHWYVRHWYVLRRYLLHWYVLQSLGVAIITCIVFLCFFVPPLYTKGDAKHGMDNGKQMGDEWLHWRQRVQHRVL
jgi:hypothetical protein